ncbi:hypothetical protein AB0M97_00315 [Streptomyces sp. NPDC051207]|uniref:hypothetical protein n=1 Tax=Streptomyces sp. NPDC051207 TaxID=3154641 RepID=UPI00343FA5FC
MRPHRARTAVQPFVALALFAGTACGAQSAGGEPPPRSEARARAVADAWNGSPAAAAWRRGLVPTGDVVQLPEGAFRSGADTRAYALHDFELRGPLPGPPGEDAEVTWENGDRLTLPLLTARGAYRALDRGDGPGPHLTVTGVRAGRMTLGTSRGPASVPAWLFTLKGYDTPLRRIAVRPTELPAPPGAAPEAGAGLWKVGRLTGVSGDGRSVTVRAGHGACDDGPVVDVLETQGSVVLSGRVTGTDDGPCTAQLLYDEVTVELGRPLGDRAVLDALTGRPVPYGDPVT